MQQPRMIVLGLLSIGLRYGFEMEKFVDDTELRRWAAIGMSTIYKVLKDLARDGAVTAKKEMGNKGPKRTAFELTPKGKREFKALVAGAMRSDASVYSDRIAGLVFVPTLPRKDAVAALSACDKALSKADAIVSARLKLHQQDAVAKAVITYYRDTYRAEKKALETVKKAIAQ